MTFPTGNSDFAVKKTPFLVSFGSFFFINEPSLSSSAGSRSLSTAHLLQVDPKVTAHPFGVAVIVPKLLGGPGPAL